MLVELNPNERVQDHLQEGKIAIVKFATETCPPCKMLKPVFEKLSKKNEYEDVVFIAANANKHPQARDYGVSSVPTLLFFNGKKVLGQNVGFVPEQKLGEFLSKLENDELSN
ncbi:MAG: thioredoxin family protein [Candidatus Izimaplasma sp.]|nr:thioredoxin family protein [Candidatus Izimaplasma bacterium]